MQFLCRRAYLGMRTAWTWRRACVPVSANTTPIVLLGLLLALSVASYAQETDNPRDRVYVFKSDQDCPPFEYVENNRLKGMNVEILEIVAQMMDLNIRFDWGVWSDIRSELEAGEIDGLTGMMYSEDRSRYAHFSASYNTISYALFVRQDSVVTSLEKAAGLTIAVQEGDHAHDYLLSTGFSGVIIPVPAAAEALKKLDAGACQGALIGRVHGLYLLNEMHLDSIMAGDTAIQLNQDCCFAVSKGNEWLLAQLNEGLRVIRNNGQYNDIHQRWMGFDINKKNQGRYLVYIYVGLAIILAIFIWAQILRRQVRRRTADLKRSEERYRSLVEKLPDGIAVLRDNEFLFANRAAAILFTGNGKMELTGTSVLPYLHPEDRPAGLVHLSALPEPDAPLSDVRIVRPGSHEIRHAETAGIMIDFHDGPATLIMLRDITERKQAEYAVLRERNLVRAIMEASPVGILMMDESGVMIFANQQAEQIFRLQRAQICERTYNDPQWQITDLDGAPFDMNKLPFARVMATRKMVRDVRYCIRHADGSSAIISMGGAPLFDAMGQLAGAVLTLEDVTAQVAATQDQERHWRRVQRQQTAIIHVSQDKTLREGNFLEAAKHIVEHAAETLEVDSASVWLLKSNNTRLCCAVAWDSKEKAWVTPDAIPASTIPDYLYALETSRYIDASDAQNDKRTTELCPGYLRPGNVGALLDVPVRVGGRLVGVICNEHRGIAREWLPDEIQFAVEMADQAGQAYAAEEHRLAEEERNLFESKLQHTQKLESLGVLAGGIAHDFNNLLMAIIGNAELALMDISHANPARQAVMEIEAVSRRAADLCRQMLAYSGKGKFVVEPISLNDVISEIGQMLGVSIPKNVVLRYNLAENLPAVEADVSQMRQVLMNLVINASEAIGDKDGLITVSTCTAYCDQAYFAKTNIHENLPDGDYVGIEVADTGEGMDKETIARIFEPFFTTKFTGRGLGLAAVLGIVRGHRGALKVYSEPGKGTTFKVLLPASKKDAIAFETESVQESAWVGSGTILLVDDEEVLLSVTSKMLTRLGFEVLTARDGIEGLEVYQENRDEITCVIMDLTMPNMNGEECFRELRRINGEVSVILCSGFNEQDATQRFVGKGLAGFIQKPYRFSTLSAKLREILGD
jgi:PAS domain S-box-containing protein